jgi:mono/diheme cytochrome c family protein
MNAEVRRAARRSALARLTRVGALCALTLATSCEWFTDFKRQPMVTTWESVRPDSLVVRGSPQGSVPTTGTFAPGYAVSYLPGIAQIDSMAGIANPTPVSEASLANGRKYFTINCLPCHGERADGQGPVVRYGFPPISLQTDLSKNRTDGYLFGMMRNGRGLMPSYNRIEEMDRWDVVNYLRMLQGRTTGATVATTPLAPPGVTGAMLPGPTRLGPTRAVPHRSVPPRQGAAADTAAGSGTVPNADSTRRPPADE